MLNLNDIIGHINNIGLEHRINFEETPVYIKKLTTTAGIYSQANCKPKWTLPIIYLDFINDTFYPKREFFNKDGINISQEEYISYILTTRLKFSNTSSVFDKSTNIKYVNIKPKEYVLTYSAGSSFGEYLKKYLPVIVTNN